MLLYLLSDSKHTLEDRHENYSLFETCAIIDNQEYIIHVILFFNNLENNEYNIRLYRKSDMELMISGKEFTLIDVFYTYDPNAILLGQGKKGELYYLDSYSDIHEIIKYNETTNFLEYTENILDDEDYFYELVEEDVNLLKYVQLYIELENEIIRDLNFENLIELPKFLAPLLAKFQGTLFLGGIKELSDESSLFLSKHTGILDLSGLENMTNTTIHNLLAHKGPILNNSIQLRANEQDGYYIKKYGEEDDFKLYSYKFISNQKSIEIIKPIYNDTLYVILDNLYLINGVIFLRALGISTNRQIFENFEFELFAVPNTLEALQQYEANSQEMRETYLAENINHIWIDDFIDEDTGERIHIERCDRLFSVGERLTLDKITRIVELPDNQIWITNTYNSNYESIIHTIKNDPTNNCEEALFLIYRILNGRDADSIEIAREYFYNKYFNSEHFLFTDIVRDFLNEALGYDETLTDEEVEAIGLGLRQNDILIAIKNILPWEDYFI